MVTPAACAWLLLLSPLAAAADIVVFGLRRRALSAAIALVGILLSFACAVWLLCQVTSSQIPVPFEVSVSWLGVPGFVMPFGVLIDRLSLIMALVVTGVGSGIFLYSLGYMAEDAGYTRYFGMLSLFIFSMLTIVVATNWIQLFIGWELVGFCSYILIGHWYERPAAADAGKKAFMVNRVADVGFLVGIVALWAHSSSVPAERTLHYATLQTNLSNLLQSGWLSHGTLGAINLLLFCGVLGKSAQMPLHVWLPDAMEGPTSVSALIHAATMVAAGVYMLARTFWLFAESPLTLTVIAWVGASTAFFTACLALVESDLKRILAYSTLSQLGYMVMAIGLGGPHVGMYHLTTHAFFKALLFLSAGSVIHGTHRQNIWQLGGLWRTMPWTSLAFLIGSLALCGVPPFSGFFSKDEILALAYEGHHALFAVGTITAGLTAFYTTRAAIVAFTGESSAHLHPHESGLVMLVPLAVLSALSIVGGYLGIPAFLGEHAGAFHWDVARLSIMVVVVGASLAWLIYAKRVVAAEDLRQRFSTLHALLIRRYYFDDFYTWYVTRVQQRIMAATCAWFERYVIIGFAVNGTAMVTQTAGRLMRRVQTGVVQTYALLFFIGVIWAVYVIGRG